MLVGNRLVWLALSLLLVGCGSQDSGESVSADKKQTIRLGLALRTIDETNLSVHRMFQGIGFAVDRFKEKNPSIDIELVVEEFGQSREEIVASGLRLLEAGVPAVIGAEWTSEALLLGDLFNGSKILFLTPTASNPEVTRDKAYVFRGCFNDEQAVNALSEFVTKSIDDTSKIGVVIDRSATYSAYLGTGVYELLLKDSTLKNVTAVEFPRVRQEYSGVDPVMRLDETKLRESLIALKEAGVDHLLAPVYLSKFVELVRIAKSIDYSPTYYGPDGWGSNKRICEDLLRIGVDCSASEIHAYRYSYLPELTSDEAKRLRAKLAEIGQEPTMMSVVAYDAAAVLLAAIKQSTDVSDAEAIRLSLQSGNFNGVNGQPISFDQSGNLKQPYLYFYEQKDGEWLYHGQISNDVGKQRSTY